MSYDPLTDPLPASRWQSVDPPIYQQTTAALGWVPPSRLTRALRDASAGVTMAGFRIRSGMTAFADSVRTPPRVHRRWAALCRADGLEPPVTFRQHRADLTDLIDLEP